MDRLSQFAPAQPTLAPDGNGALVEIFQLEGTPSKKQRMTLHGGVYVDSRLWQEEITDRDRRVLAAVETGFLYGLRYCPGVYAPDDLFDPSVVAGLVAEGLRMRHPENLPVRLHFLSSSDVQQCVLGDGALRLRVLLPDMHPAARHEQTASWGVFLIHPATGFSTDYLGLVDYEGYCPVSELEDQEEPSAATAEREAEELMAAATAPQRIPVQPGGEPAAAPPFSFSTLRELDPDFWNGVGDLLAGLDRPTTNTDDDPGADDRGAMA